MNVVRLRRLRKQRNHTIYTLAAKAKVHFTTINRIEKGRMSPTVACLEKLASALHVHITEFFPPSPAILERRMAEVDAYWKQWEEARESLNKVDLSS